MKAQINDQELEKVVGGTVRLSGTTMRVAFTTKKLVCNLKNVSYMQALAAIDELYEQNKTAGNAEYDDIVYNYFLDQGWI